MEHINKGIGAGSGIAIGRAMWKKQALQIVKASSETAEVETNRLSTAMGVAAEGIQQLIQFTKEKVGEHEAQIFEAHLMMLHDPEFKAQTIAKIQSDSVTAEYAVRATADEFIAVFSAIEDAYLKERAADLKDVSDRLIKALLGVEEESFNQSGIIIVAEDLTPSDTAKIDKDKVCGFITEIGGTTSHSAIMARTIGIPAIVGAGHLASIIQEGDQLAFDGDSGAFYVNPDESVLESLYEKKKLLEAERAKLELLKGQLTQTADGKRVEVACNIGKPDDLIHVLENDGEGVGLFRSEFLYMDREQMPTEEEQFIAYKTVLEGLGDKPVVIRTLDIGGDKNIPYLNIPKEENPFLGFRAIRYCLKHTDVFKIQMKALLRAGLYGNLKIMMPMISGVQEVLAAKVLIEECKAELDAAGVPYTHAYQLGIMIEIPSAAICADLLAKEVDFFSIGTNDLIQYTIAVDRMNQDIADLYSSYHPAVLRLIKNVIDRGHEAGIWVGMCGEAAGNPKMIPLLLGMGLDEFSMNPSKVLRAREIISNLKVADLAPHVDTVLSLPDPQAVENYIHLHLHF